MKRLAVFASGNGSNFRAIHNHVLNETIPASLALLVSDQPTSNAVQYAKREGIPFVAVDVKAFSSKEAYEGYLLKHLKEARVDLLVLAGYMRLIGKTLLKHFEGRIINIHPSLLPEYKGLHAIKKAWESGAKVTGVSVHYVDQFMDNGRLIMQEAIEINHASLSALTEAVHKLEHRLYKEAINKVLEDLK